MYRSLMRFYWVVTIAVLTSAAKVSAEMYRQDELAADRQRISQRIAEMHSLITRADFLPADAGRLSGVRVNTPDIAPNGDPMGFLAARGQVFMPVAGLKFIEDLTMAYAWRYHRGQSLQPMDEYLAMLRWKPEQDWPAGRYLNPLQALGVPDKAWERDAQLAELGTSLRNEAWAFLLAHELAHVYYRHPGNSAPAPMSQANEAEADAFAMQLMERSDTIPLGALLYFQATAAFYASRADQASDQAYARWQRDKATHPVNSQRLLAMSRMIQLWARRVSDSARREALLFIGEKLELFAQGLDEPAMQQLIVRRAVYGDPRDLKAR